MWLETYIKQKYPQWTLIVASGGADALKKTESTEPDLMILDVNMPGMDGFTLATALQAKFPNGYITMLTANVKESTKKRSESLGVDLVGKPISDEKMQAILSHI